MLKWSWIILVLLISCNSKIKKEEIPLTFLEKSLLKDSVVINLPMFEHGLPFYEDDSTTYLNIYLINDSTVQVNEEIFKDFNQIKSPFFLAKNISEKYTSSKKMGQKEPVNSSFIYYLEELKTNDFQINIFCDTSIHFGTLDKLYDILFRKIKNSGRRINLIDKNNSFIEIRHSIFKTNVMHGCGIRNYLEILVNYKNQLLIEGNWGKTFDNIKSSVVNWYLDTNDDWGLDNVSIKTCNENLKMLKCELDENDNKSEIEKHIINWENRKKTVKLIGEYKTSPRIYAIIIQADSRVKITSYFKILDKINEGLISLRNDLCINKFNIPYRKLNLTINKETRIKNAVDEVYPVLFNPKIFFSRTPPSPPSTVVTPPPR